MSTTSSIERTDENREPSTTQVFHTIGYGGRSPSEFLTLLKQHGVTLVVDVRLRPDRASMGTYVKARSPDKGIEKLLAAEGIRYLSLVELGNVFLESDDWKERYRALLEKAGGLLLQRLLSVGKPFCLMCAEKKVSECHREQIADHLIGMGYQATHIE